MSALTKKPLTKSNVQIIVTTTEGSKSIILSKKKAAPILKLVENNDSSEYIDSSVITQKNIAKFTKPGLAVKGYRIRENLSQMALSKKMNITQQNLSAMENGKRPIGKEMAKRLAKVFKCNYRIFL